jgi:hypothetical protein
VRETKLSYPIVALVLLGLMVAIGYCIHLQLGSEALNAWGAYLTGGATIVLSSVAIVAGFQGLREYRSRMIAEKSKWFLQLYEKLFENPQYKDVRRRLDYDDADEIKALLKADLGNQKFTFDQQVKFDEFTDYLNFFELIALLKAIGQLTSEDIRATFDYYLRLLTHQRNPEIRQYLKKEGFENLDKLLNEYETEDPTRSTGTHKR